MAVISSNFKSNASLIAAFDNFSLGDISNKFTALENVNNNWSIKSKTNAKLELKNSSGDIFTLTGSFGGYPASISSMKLVTKNGANFTLNGVISLDSSGNITGSVSSVSVTSSGNSVEIKGQLYLFESGGESTISSMQLTSKEWQLKIDGTFKATSLTSNQLSEATLTSLSMTYKGATFSVKDISLDAVNDFNNTANTAFDELFFQNMLSGGDVINGGKDANLLNGYGGADSIYGGAGNDTLIGGAGNDTLDGGAGIDTVDYSYSSDWVAIQLGGISPSAAIPNLNEIDTIRNIENVIGSAYNDTLIGSSEANVLNGGAGNDTLDGGAGIDSLIGGAGDDIYIVDNAKDKVTENSSEGTDEVQSSVSWTLGANFEKLTLTGTGALNATGNNQDNVITGNSANNTLSGLAGNDQLDGGAGNDVLIGGSGNDTLTGGSGADIFKFDTALNANTNLDTITDFGDGADKISLSKSIFASVKAGVKADNLVTGDESSVLQANDFLRFNAGDQTLYYDADGSGTKFQAVAVVELTGVSSLSASDFIIV